MEVEISSEYWEWSKTASGQQYHNGETCIHLVHATVVPWVNSSVSTMHLGDGKIVNNGAQREPGLVLRLYIVIYFWLGVLGSKIIKARPMRNPIL